MGEPPGGTRAQVAELRRWWDRADRADHLVVPTSGSSGAPRGVVLSRAAVTASAEASSARLGGPAAWVLALPVRSVAGVQALVRSWLVGVEPVLLDDHQDWASATSAAATAADAAGVGARRTALVPTQLHRLDRAGRLPDLAGFDQVLVGGAAADADLVDRARAAGVRVVRTYGLTETCGGCVYDGEPLDRVSVRVDDGGRINVTGPVLFDGYVDDPEATAAVLRDGWLQTGDLGRIDVDGWLQVLGRADEMAVSGGVNVSLAAVGSALRSHPAVADALAVAVPDAEWGHRVVAVVRPGPDLDPPTLPALRDHVATLLPREWAPRTLTLVDRLPLLPGGKPDRAAARRLAGSTPER